MSTVLQPWVETLPWKQQSILFSGLRGPDHAYTPNIKEVSKWMRSVTQNNADPSKPYMNDFQKPRLEALEKELEHSPCHFVHHFADALAIIAYNHPEEEVSLFAAGIHYYIAEEIFHWVPETPFTFKMRHRDRTTTDPDLDLCWQSHVKAQRDGYFSIVSERFHGYKSLTSK